MWAKALPIYSNPLKLSVVPCLDETLKSASKYSLACFVIFMVASYFLATILGPLLFFFTPEGLEICGGSLQLFFLVSGVRWVTPIRVNIGLFFLFCWVLYLFCFFAAWSFHKGFHRVVASPMKLSLRDLFKNYLFSLPLFVSLLFVMVLAAEAIQNMLRFPSGPPPAYENLKGLEPLVYLAYSPIIEEVGFRFIPIGTYLFVFTLIVGRGMESRLQLLKTAITSLFLPDRAKQKLRVRNVHESSFWNGINLGEWVFVAFTSVWFGYTHYLYGWQPGKILTASMCGVALALVYLVYGIHASILLHWWFNYYLNVYSHAHLILKSVPWPLIQSVIFSLTVLAGAFGWMWMVYYKVLRQGGGEFSF